MPLRLTKYMFIPLAIVLATVLVWAGAKSTHNRTPQDKRVSESNLPLITSSVDQLEIQSAVVDHGELILTLLNKSVKGIRALAVSSGTYRVILDNGPITDNPDTFIKPQGTYDVEIPTDDLRATVPVVISAVIYDDDSNGGKPEVVNKIRQNREELKQRGLSNTIRKGGAK